MKKRLGILLLVCFMLLGLVACGDSDKAEISSVILEERLNKDFVYYASEVDFEFSSTVSDVDFKVYGQNIYYPKAQSIVNYSVAEEKETVDTYSWQDAPGEWAFERVSYSKSGEVYALVRVGAGSTGTSASGANAVYNLCKFDTDRNLVFAVDMTKHYAENKAAFSGSDRLEVGEDGRIYLSSANALWVFTADGKYAEEVSFANAEALCVKDLQASSEGTLYVLYEDANAQTQYVAEIDTEKCAVCALQQTIGLDGISVLTDRLLGFNAATVYTYDRAELRLTELFTWSECRMGDTAVYMAKELTDGRIFTAGNPTWGGVENHVIKSMQVGSAEASETGKIDIRMAALIRADAVVWNAVNTFNRNNPQYNIVLEIYGEDSKDEGIARLEAEIAAGNGPDIVDMNYGKLQSMVEDLYLEDLSMYLAESEVFGEGDFLEIALEEYNVDGFLAAIPHHFTMQMTIGNSDILGEEPGWTMEEYLDFMAEQGGEQVFANGTHGRSIIWDVIRLNEDFFVDRAACTCNFDNDIFRKVVEVVANYPLDYDRMDRPKDPYALLKDGTAVMTSMAINDFTDLQYYEHILGGALNCIGYPVEEGIGVWASTSAAYGIAAMSEHKEVAWEFMEMLLQMGSTESHWSYFPTYVPNLEKMAESYINMTNLGYRTNSSQEDKFYYHAPTVEEIEEYLELLQNARPGTTDTGLLNLILEELDHYYNEEKTLEEMIADLEERGAKYLEESR